MTTFNVYDSSPTGDWDSQSQKWEDLGKSVSISPDFHPLTIKALYVTGIVLASCESIDILLNSKRFPTTYFPAYAVFASIIDLLGRCIRGNDKLVGSVEDIRTGFRWLAQPEISSFCSVPADQADGQVLVTTYTPWGSKNRDYTIKELIAMRHFAAHGQADSEGLPAFDYNILGEIPPILGNGMEEYLKVLESHREPCVQLAKARVVLYRERPIFDVLWQYHGRDQSFPAVVANAIRKNHWANERSA
jgi:hypothetical protein